MIHPTKEITRLVMNRVICRGKSDVSDETAHHVFEFLDRLSSAVAPCLLSVFEKDVCRIRGYFEAADEVFICSAVDLHHMGFVAEALA